MSNQKATSGTIDPSMQALISQIPHSVHALYAALRCPLTIKSEPSDNPELIKPSSSSRSKLRPKPLLADSEKPEAQPIFLVVSQKKITPRFRSTLRIRNLPNRILPPDSTVGLVVTDMHWPSSRNVGNTPAARSAQRSQNMERTSQWWQERLLEAQSKSDEAEENVQVQLDPLPSIQVIPFALLRSDYTEFEARRKLSSLHQLFLYDDSLGSIIPRALGKSFFGKASKHPLPIRLRTSEARPQPGQMEVAHSNAAFSRLKSRMPKLSAGSKVGRRRLPKDGRALHSAVDGALRSAIIQLAPNKVCSCSSPIAYSHMSEASAIANIARSIKFLSSKIPGGIDNIRSIHIRCPSSPTFPLYYSASEPSKETSRKLREISVSLTEKKPIGPPEEVDSLPAGQVQLFDNGSFRFVPPTGTTPTQTRELKRRFYQIFRQVDDEDEIDLLDEDFIEENPLKKRGSKGSSKEKPLLKRELKIEAQDRKDVKIKMEGQGRAKKVKHSPSFDIA